MSITALIGRGSHGFEGVCGVQTCEELMADGLPDIHEIYVISAVRRDEI